MGLVLATTLGLIIWIVLWSIGANSFDGFMITMLIVVLGAAGRLLVPHLPGRT
ncbi:MAG: hypothetical protein H0T43_10160 [Solirubrobacterales bacterium]|nr:hypothetical protein [Solirubrobacterales bacterium]